MKTLKENKTLAGLVILLIAVVAVTFAYSHCQIPCGIYDDKARLDSMVEEITTIEKAMKEITALSAEAKPNMNQIVRWVNTKEEHAGELDHTVTFYFMAQRIKPAEKTNTASYEKYIKQLTLLHEMLLSSMKCKQTTDLANVEKLRTLLKEFQAAYSN